MQVCNFWTSAYKDRGDGHILDAFSLKEEGGGIFFKESLRKNAKIVATYGCFTMARVRVDNIKLAFIDDFFIIW